MSVGIWQSRNVLLKIAEREYEHDNFKEPRWLRDRKETFSPVIEGKIKHIDSINDLRDAKFSGIEGGASFSSVISLFHLLAAGLYTTLTYFVIGTVLNLTDNRGGFIFENNEGFTAVLALLVILTSSTVVPVYTGLAESVSKQQERFNAQISGISRNLLLIDRKMNPVWLHYQNIMNRLIPEWQKCISDHSDNLIQHLLIKQQIIKFVLDSEHVDHFNKKALIQFLSQKIINVKNSVEPNDEILLTEENWKDIRLRLNDWILNDRISEDSKSFEAGSEIDRRRRALTIECLSQKKFFPSEESEVLDLIKKIIDKVKNKNSPIDSNESEFGDSFEIFSELKKQILNAYSHHLENVSEIIPAISELCLDCGISVDSFLDDYHLFSHSTKELQRFNEESLSEFRPDNVTLAVIAQQLYLGLYFFICQDDRDKKFIDLSEYEYKYNDGVDFFRDLFSDVCELMHDGSVFYSDADKTEQSEVQKEKLKDNEQLFLELNYQRSALHNWVRASQSACRRKRWMELEKNEDSKNRTTFYGIPVLPIRQARLDDVVGHAGLPTSDMKRLRFKSLIDILPVSNAFFGTYQELLDDVITKMSSKHNAAQSKVSVADSVDDNY